MTTDSAVRSAFDTLFGGERNMSTVERAVSVGIGLAMAAGGLRRADGPGALMGVAGAALVARGMTGHCGVKAMLESGRGGQGLGHAHDQSREMAGEMAVADR
jgi:uncharacterized membrane protein